MPSRGTVSVHTVSNPISNTAREIAVASRVAGDLRSFVRLACASVAFRILRYASPRWKNHVLVAKTRSGAQLAFRLNRGDIQSVREVWFEEIYRVPTTGPLGSIIDLGANIGLTSVYLSNRHAPEALLLVEPEPTNAVLIRRNLQQNGILATVVEAAVGREDGRAAFEAGDSSNLGRLGSGSSVVDVTSMETLLRLLPGHRADLVKMDIEGAEGLIIYRGASWLGSVSALIVELHPSLTDPAPLIDALVGSGFTYCPAGSLWTGSMDYFYRPESDGE
jgi:FkbM family methyltransferase